MVFDDVNIPSIRFLSVSRSDHPLNSNILVAYICSYTGKILIDCLYDDEDDEIVDLFQGKFIPFDTCK